MKFVKKSDCSYKQGHLVVGSGRDEEIIGLPVNVLALLNQLNYSIQAAEYNKEYRPQVGKIPPKFEPSLSYGDRHEYKVYAETPTVDARVDEAMKLVDELKMSRHTDKVNKLLDYYKDLCVFVDEDEFVPCEHVGNRFGFPSDWNFLAWTLDDLYDMINFIAENGEEAFTRECCFDRIQL